MPGQPQLEPGGLNVGVCGPALPRSSGSFRSTCSRRGASAPAAPARPAASTSSSLFLKLSKLYYLSIPSWSAGQETLSAMRAAPGPAEQMELPRLLACAGRQRPCGAPRPEGGPGERGALRTVRGPLQPPPRSRHLCEVHPSRGHGVSPGPASPNCLTKRRPLPCGVPALFGYELFYGGTLNPDI